MKRRIFIAADHGLAVVYFLQSDVVSTLRDAGNEIVFLTADGLQDKIEKRFGHMGIRTEGLRLDRAMEYERRWRDTQWWLAFLRRVGGSIRMNTGAMDSYIDQVAVEEPNRRRLFLPFARMLIWMLRRASFLRRLLVRVQAIFTPSIYSDLFEQYQPSLVVASTPGWRLDRYLLREARRAGIKTGSVVVGWDNPSSYSIPGAEVDEIVCWSEIQKHELVEGSDWKPTVVHIGGIPSYDGYLTQQWLMTRQEYYALHGLDPDRKLLSYACSFISFSPNIQNVEALVDLVSADRLAAPVQLLVRLHPNHFMDVSLFKDERERIEALAQDHPNVHVVQPIPLGGALGYYSGEDMPEKASMLAHSDVFLTVYSTMVVEAAIHDTPIVSVCIDSPVGWDVPRKYTLPLSEIGNWPTHRRFIDAKAGRIVFDSPGLEHAINAYLQNPSLEHAERSQFVQHEITYTDGSAGQRTGAIFASLIDGVGQ